MKLNKGKLGFAAIFLVCWFALLVLLRVVCLDNLAILVSSFLDGIYFPSSESFFFMPAASDFPLRALASKTFDINHSFGSDMNLHMCFIHSGFHSKNTKFFSMVSSKRAHVRTNFEFLPLCLDRG